MMLAPLAIALLIAQVQIQSPRTSVLKDGDVVYVERGARVKVITRSEGIVRAIYNADQRWLVLLIDYAGPNGAQPDGFVDFAYTFYDLQGEWTLGPKWEGSAAVEEVSLAGQGSRLAVNLRTQSGLYQIGNAQFGGTAPDFGFDPTALARVSHRSGSSGIVGRSMTFDMAETREAEQAAMRASGTISRTVTLPNGATARSSLTAVGVPADPRPPAAAFASGTQPVRVGSGIRTPQKIVDARPVYPPIAQSARVQGVVILEITIAADGSVADAKVLRSIPLLDQAALDCVRQWKYEPTQVNGTAVPVIMTVTVNFALQ